MLFDGIPIPIPILSSLLSLLFAYIIYDGGFFWKGVAIFGQLLFEFGLFYVYKGKN